MYRSPCLTSKTLVKNSNWEDIAAANNLTTIHLHTHIKITLQITPIQTPQTIFEATKNPISVSNYQTQNLTSRHPPPQQTWRLSRHIKHRPTSYPNCPPTNPEPNPCSQESECPTKNRHPPWRSSA